MRTYNALKVITLIEKLIYGLDAYLVTQIEDDHFKQRAFYGEAHYAAGLALLNKRLILRSKLFKHYFSQTIKLDSHPEFNAYAWHYYLTNNKSNKYLLLRQIKFKTIFLRKVTNWVLLRSLVRIRFGGLLKLIGLIQAWFILKINNYEGHITDNTLRRFYTKKKARSSQYHTFSTMIAGVIFKETGSIYFKKIFLNSLNLLIKDRARNEFIWRGRGKKQLFGYAALVYSLVLAYQITQRSSYIGLLEDCLIRLRKFQLSSGFIPLALVRNNQRSYWEAYNNLFDYQSFLFLHLVLSLLTLYKINKIHLEEN